MEEGEGEGERGRRGGRCEQHWWCQGNWLSVCLPDSPMGGVCVFICLFRLSMHLSLGEEEPHWTRSFLHYSKSLERISSEFTLRSTEKHSFTFLPTLTLPFPHSLPPPVTLPPFFPGHSPQDRKTYQFYKGLINFRNRGSASDVLKSINPLEVMSS